MSMHPGLEDKRANGKTALEVDLLGQRMVLKANEDPEHLERLAAYVRAKSHELAPQGAATGQKHAVLVALNIADDYFRVLDELHRLKYDVAKRSRAMISELDTLL